MKKEWTICLKLFISAFVVLSFLGDVYAASDQWESITPPGSSGYVFNTVAIIGNYVFLGTDHGIYKSTNRGSTWSQVNTGLNSHLDIKSIAIGWVYNSGTGVYEVNSSSYVFIGTSDGGVFSSAIGGSSWTATSTGLTDSNILDLKIDQYQAVNGNYTNIYAATPTGVFISTTTGTYWLSDNSGLSGYANKLSTDYSGGKIYAMTNENKIYSSIMRSLSGSYESWTQVFDANGTTTNNISLLNAVGNIVWLSTTKGIYKSDNMGLNWASTSIGLASNNVKNISSDYINGNIAYASTYGDGVYRTTNEAIVNSDNQIPEWLPVNIGLTDTNIISVEVDPSDSTYVYALSSSGLYKLVYSSDPVEFIDLTPPSTITDLSVTPMVVTTNEDTTYGTTTLIWTAPGNNGKFGTSTSYEIRYSTSTTITSGNYSSVPLITDLYNPIRGISPNQTQPNPNLSGTREVYNVNLPDMSQTYYFAIKSSDGTNYSEISNIVSLNSVPLSAPSDLSASVQSTSQINLSWTASVGTVGYRIYRCSGSSCSPVSLINTVTSGTTYNDTGLSASTVYGYLTVSYDSDGNNATSSIVYATTDSIVINVGGGGSGSSGGGGASVSLPNNNVITDIITTQLPDTCSSTKTTSSSARYVFTTNLFVGSSGEAVKQLQIFLNNHGFTIKNSGPGSPGNETIYFGESTKLALIRFQNTYKNDILIPFGLTKGTGYFGSSTLKKVMELSAVNTSINNDCVTSNQIVITKIPLFTRALSLGSNGLDVKALQVFLNTHGFTVSFKGVGSLGKESLYFGPATTAALARFQAANNITPAIGYFGPVTMKKVNEIGK